MNSDDSGQDKLQQALATLRPKPPPRDLSAQVRNRLENPQPPPPPTLLQRLGIHIEARPMLVGLAGVAVSLLVVVVALASRNVKPPVEGPATAAPDVFGQPGGTGLGGLGNPAPASPQAGASALPSSGAPLLVPARSGWPTQFTRVGTSSFPIDHAADGDPRAGGSNTQHRP